jgi:hypothetical protein
MPWWRTLRSSCPSSTERRALAAALALLALGAAACSDDDASCGPPEGAGTAITLATTPASEVDGQWGDFEASANNDCPPPGGPGSGAISLTIEGVEVGGTSRFSLCLPRPDEIGSAPVSLADADLVQLGTVSAGTDDGCRFQLDRDMPPAGTVSFAGYCADGTDPAGFEMILDGTIGITRICDSDGGEPTEEALTATLAGSTAVGAL